VTVLHGGFGVVVLVTMISVQHVSLVHFPLAQTVSSGLLLKPDGQVKLPQVGAGVVVTVLHGGFGVVVTVVVIFTQQVASVHLPLAQTVSSGLLSKPDGQVKLPQVGAGVVVTVLQGGFGVVVLVMAGVVVLVAAGVVVTVVASVVVATVQGLTAAAGAAKGAEAGAGGAAGAAVTPDRATATVNILLNIIASQVRVGYK